jgi:mRNA interferase RelE/StbE
MYEIIFSKKFLNKLKKLDKNLQERIIKVIERARIRPYLHFERLVGKRVYKLRVGEYRIIADMDKGKLIILILDVGHRRNIYK